MKQQQLFLITCLCIFLNVVEAQTKIDSLKNLLKTNVQDTNRVNRLDKLCHEYRLIGDYDNGLSCAKQALQLAEQLNFKQGVAHSYSSMGNIYMHQGNYFGALKMHFASLKIMEVLGDKNNVASSYNNIAAIFMHQGNY